MSAATCTESRRVQPGGVGYEYADEATRLAGGNARSRLAGRPLVGVLAGGVNYGGNPRRLVARAGLLFQA